MDDSKYYRVRQKELERVQRGLAEYKGVRTVEKWNELREELKSTENDVVMGDLDASAYITKWLKGYQHPSLTPDSND